MKIFYVGVSGVKNKKLVCRHRCVIIHTQTPTTNQKQKSIQVTVYPPSPTPKTSTTCINSQQYQRDYIYLTFINSLLYAYAHKMHYVCRFIN